MLQDIYCKLIFSKKLIYGMNSQLKHIMYYIKIGSTELDLDLLILWIIACLKTFVISAKYIFVLNILQLLYTFLESFNYTHIIIIIALMKFLNVYIKSILILLRATICIFQIKNEYHIQVKKYTLIAFGYLVSIKKVDTRACIYVYIYTYIIVRACNCSTINHTANPYTHTITVCNCTIYIGLKWWNSRELIIKNLRYINFLNSGHMLYDMYIHMYRLQIFIHLWKI